MTSQAFVLNERDEILCDAPCYNTNVFAPGGYKLGCDQCSGRRGHYDRENQWIECSNAWAQGAFVVQDVREVGRSRQANKSRADYFPRSDNGPPFSTKAPKVESTYEVPEANSAC